METQPSVLWGDTCGVFQSTLTLSQPFPESPLQKSTRGKEGLDVVGILGAGGMGVVHLAHQKSVDRLVALKTLEAGDFDDLHKEQLVREAWVLAQLEHPNIPPIYTVTSYQGGPAIVFKRVLGQQWSTYLQEPKLLEKLKGTKEAFDWHIEVLLRVIDAVRFAHSRGILHRDLKPSNVMIGEFGEVYLMDWGLAVSMRPEHEGAIQLARDVHQTAGTYCYMAPEMLDPQGVGISELTDVYQLGGLLYEICMGAPPHWGDNWDEIEACIRLSHPFFEGELPIELMLICRRALFADPSKRFQCADEFRAAVEAFREHRVANHLAEEGDALLLALGSRSEVDSLDRMDAYQVIAQARFAFQQSLMAWQENERGVSGLIRCNEVAAEIELAAGEPGRALALLQGHEESPLLGHCRAAQKERESRTREDELLRRRNCRELDRPTRRAAIASIGTLWFLLPLLLQWLLTNTTYQTQASSQLAFLSLWLVVGRYGERWIRSTETNYRSYGMVLAATVLALVIKGGSHAMAVPADVAQVYDLFIFFTAGLLTSVFIDWRMWPSAVGYLVAFVLSAVNPSWCLGAMAASNAVLGLTAAYVWRGQKRENH
ncbi:MAG: serine/threonine protein kinase [Myxococcales bacterium]|nr:serine/threonine protein kinase [Myxococcales bacterium]